MISGRPFGLALAVGASAVTCAAYYVIPYNARFPALVLAVPLVAAVAGVFQFITGVTLLEANSRFHDYTVWKKLAVAALALFLVVVAVCAFFVVIVLVEG